MSGVGQTAIIAPPTIGGARTIFTVVHHGDLT
jgi:hypothetical protein